MRSKLDLFSTNEKTSPLVHIIHSYDYNGNRIKRHDSVHAANSELYTYDSLGQIKTLNRGILNNDHTSVTTINHSESWNFDKTGNWLQYTKNGNTETRTHNAANELQGIATHDANGNMVLMPGLKGKYDAWNRLVEIRDSNDNLIAQYEYNGLNQRIKKTVNNIETKSFFNENWQEVESITNNQVTSYVWGLRYIDDLVLREKGEERLYSLADPNWNVVAICNNSGVVQERYTYDAFGKRNVFDEDFTVKMGTEFNWNRAFTGQVLDIETGLMLYRNRYYSTQLGKFISKDPIGYAGKDENLYRYVKGNPILFCDSKGLMSTIGGGSIGCAAGIAVGGAISVATGYLTCWFNRNCNQSHGQILCKAAFDAAGGCVAGAITGALIASGVKPGKTVACINAAVTSFFSAVGSVICASDDCPISVSFCQAASALVGGLLVCLFSEGVTRDAILAAISPHIVGFTGGEACKMFAGSW
ncbi:MAG: hypothetical protein LBE12_01045 [Planctomycetaceae bacterium]|jgi:RHS repeat-associated protein|nr:hypothetical protein [Planctomycetaceae bacterium]